MIVHKSFKHGWFYHYRLHKLNSENLCNPQFFELDKYLNSLFENCPDKHFNKIRSSSMKFPLDFEMKKTKNHEVSSLAQEGVVNGTKSAHTNVQLHMLNYDPKTIAVEVPLWIESHENMHHERIFNTNEPLSGHIDVLRIEDDKIWVWDFKPGAHLEKFAVTQTFFYSLMLSKRTGIPLNDFRCGYFDDELAFMFKPEIKALEKLSFEKQLLIK